MNADAALLPDAVDLRADRVDSVPAGSFADDRASRRPTVGAVASSLSTTPARSAAAPFLSCSCSFLTSSCSASTRAGSSSGAALEPAGQFVDAPRCAPASSSYAGSAGDGRDAADALRHPLLRQILNSPIGPCAAGACRRRTRPSRRASLRPATPAPISTTRTGSGYFSPKTARTPGRSSSPPPAASSTAVTGRSRTICSLTRRSIVAEFVGVQRLVVLKSKRVFSASTSEPFCSTCSPSTLPQRQVEQVRRGVVAHDVDAPRRRLHQRRRCRRRRVRPRAACRRAGPCRRAAACPRPRTRAGRRCGSCPVSPTCPPCSA